MDDVLMPLVVVEAPWPEYAAAAIEGPQDTLHLNGDDALCGEAGHVPEVPEHDADLGVPGDLHVEQASVANP
eukprot:15811512-Heterocapsa_arctica.AAC.1